MGKFGKRNTVSENLADTLLEIGPGVSAPAMF